MDRPEWLSVWLSRAEASDTAVRQACSMLLTCIDFGWARNSSSGNLLSCKRSKSNFEDHNRPLTCGNVELRGLEPLASCMP